MKQSSAKEDFINKVNRAERQTDKDTNRHTEIMTDGQGRCHSVMVTGKRQDQQPGACALS